MRLDMYRDSHDVDVLIFVEHKDRELETACEIAGRLKREYGLKVAVSSAIFHSLLAAIFVRPKVLVSPFPGIGAGSVIALFRSIYGDKITYINLNLEQFLSSLNRSIRIPKGPFTRMKLKQFCWGKRFKKFLVSNGVSEENVFITGKPAISILKSKMSEGKANHRSKIAKQFGLPAQVRWLFFPMSCGIAFSSDYHMKTRISAGWNKEWTWTYRKYANDTLNEIFRWIAGLKDVADGRDYLIILRPHPSVSVAQYEERLMQVVGHIPSYVHISKDLTAHDWLLASDACYATLSSVALDANIAGLPAFRIEPQPLPPFLENEDWLKGLPRLTTFDEFYSSIRLGKSFIPERLEIIREFIDVDLNAIETTAEYLAEFARERPFASWSLPGLLKAIYSCPRRYLGSLLRLLAAATNINPFGVLPKGLYPDYFNRNDVIKFLQKKASG